MSDSIPDAYLTDGLIVFGGPVGGYVAAGFEIEMPNLQSASHEQCNQVQDAVSNMLRQLPEGMKLQVMQFQTPVAAERLLDYQRQTESCKNDGSRRLRNSNFIQLAQWREGGKLLHKRVLIYVSIPIPAVPRAKGSSLEEHYKIALDGVRPAFKEFEQSAVQSLLPIGGRITPLNDPDNARLWANALNPSQASNSSHDPATLFDPNLSLTDNFWNSEIRGRGPQGFMFDGYYHMAITIRRLSSETYFSIMHRVTYLPYSDVTITVHISRLPKEKVLKQTQFSLDRLNQQLLRKPDERQAVTARQQQEKVRRLAAGEAVPLELEIIILLRAKSQGELADKAAAIKSTLQGMNGMQYYEATLPSTSRALFVKTLPGWTNSRHQGFKLYCEDRSAADLLPLCNSFSGHPGPVQALFPGNDNNLVNVVMSLGEGDASTPQHAVILGGTGGGKSELLKKVAFETDVHVYQTFIIEEGFSQAPYTRSHGIEPVVFKVGGNQTLNPLDTQGLPRTASEHSTQTSVIARMVGLPSDSERAQRVSALISRQLVQLCEDHAEQQLRNWPQQKRARFLRHALVLRHLAKTNGITEFEAFGIFNELSCEKPAAAENLLNQYSQAQLDEFESVEKQSVHSLVFAYLSPEEHLTLSSLCDHFELAEQDEEECRQLATGLSPWLRGGNYGAMFDGPSNVTLNGAVVHYELGTISEAAKEIKAVVGFLIINSVRNRVLSLPRALKKRVIVEEVSRFLDVPGGEQILRELYEQFRKHNCQIIIVAQQYSRIADTRIRAAVMGNTSAWFIFNTGDRRDVERLGADLGLFEVAQASILRYVRPDQQIGPKYSEFLYYHSSAGQPICGPLDLAPDFPFLDGDFSFHSVCQCLPMFANFSPRTCREPMANVGGTRRRLQTFFGQRAGQVKEEEHSRTPM